MTIHFKNGTKKEIRQETAEILKRNIIEGCADFQIFSDQNDKVFLFVKLSEIVFIDCIDVAIEFDINNCLDDE